MDILDRLTFFSNMIRTCHNLYFWSYDSSFQLIQSNCTEENIFNSFLTLDHFDEKILAYAESYDTPLILTNSIGLMWVAAFEKEESFLRRIYILGPFFIDDFSTSNVESRLQQYRLSKTLRYFSTSIFRTLPVISLNRIFEYSIMLHFAITGEQITSSDLNYDSGNSTTVSMNKLSEGPQHHGTYEAEQEMLRMVREGDLNFQKHMSRMAMMGNAGKLSNGEPNRQMKNLVLVNITLFSRAAIEGGLPPEVSLTLTDYYFQSVEACNSMQELSAISHAMREDFIGRVHKCRQNTAYSKPIQNCIGYVELHLEEPIRLNEIASSLGYTEYYLTKKFKNEVGRTLKDFIREKRIERAKFLLKSTSLSIQEISARLQFNSQSYFTDIFHKTEGIKPSEYREGAAPEDT